MSRFRLVCLVISALVVPSVASAQTAPHPCDSLAPPNPVIDSNTVKVGFCYQMLNESGQPDPSIQFQVSLDHVRQGQAVTLTAQGPANSQGSFYFEFPPMAVSDGAHVASVWAVNGKGQKESPDYPFAVSGGAPPQAPYNPRVRK